LDKYPGDVQPIAIPNPNVFEVPWDDQDKDTKTGLYSKITISDWSQLDRFLDDFPDTGYADLFPIPSDDDGRYRLGTFWFCFFERHWSLSGMTNTLTYYK
jgi:uroporphyrinogen decarboxylase